ncbi:MAG: helix-turn-helix transcriptional regulator [Gammaproteobacteria bacterium]|nr:helix-turn-helix transcriptional regulator [Gammaproteobacteria bacterium]
MSKYSTAITRNAENASKLLKAIANPNRLMILCQLKILGERNVNQLLENLSISQPALSQHLAVMKEEELISSRKLGTSIYYSISDDIVRNVLEALDARFCDIETNGTQK